MAAFFDSEKTPGATLSVKALLSTRGVDENLSRAIEAADADGNGHLSLEEVVKVIQQERQATAQTRLFRRIAMVTAICTIIMCLATAGLTYGVVYLSKDTRVVSGVMTAKDGHTPVATSAVTVLGGGSDLFNATIAELSELRQLVIPAADGSSVNILQVRNVILTPGKSAKVFTTAGLAYEFTDDDVRMMGRAEAEAANAAMYVTSNATTNGRRLLSHMCGHFEGNLLPNPARCTGTISRYPGSSSRCNPTPSSSNFEHIFFGTGF